MPSFFFAQPDLVKSNVRRRRRRASRVRLLTLEPLEPRAMLTAELASPPPLFFHAAGSEQFGQSFVESASFSENRTGNTWGPRLEIAGPRTSGQTHFQPGDILKLRIHFPSSSLDLDEQLQVYIQYNGAVLRPEGRIVLADGVACSFELTDHIADGLECNAVDLPATADLLMEIPMQFVAEGPATISVTIVQTPAEGGVDVWETLLMETSQVFSGGANSGPAAPPPRPEDGSSPFLDDVPDAYPLPRLDSDRSDSLLGLPARALSPRRSIGTDSMNDTLLISIRSERQPVQDSESTADSARRVRILRSTWDWSLADDASAALFRPLELSDEPVLENRNDIRDHSTVVRSLLSRNHQPAREKETASRANPDTNAGTAARILLQGVRPMKLDPSVNTNDSRIVLLQGERIDAVLANWPAADATQKQDSTRVAQSLRK